MLAKSSKILAKRSNTQAKSRKNMKSSNRQLKSKVEKGWLKLKVVSACLKDQKASKRLIKSSRIVSIS